MDDKQILHHIGELVDEEHRLRARFRSGAVTSDDEQVRLRELEESLDQCWDLLRQRRAANESGQESRPAKPRPVDEVEGYLQ